MTTQTTHYVDYLQLDKLLNAQLPQSRKEGNEAHDEMLFIVVHQVYELWFKQLLHEIDSVRTLLTEESLNDEDISKVVNRLERVITIQTLLIEQLTVIETMTPMDFLEFRHLLGNSSGFQSYQFRLLENKLGLKKRQVSDEEYLACLRSDHRPIVEQSIKESSLFSLIEQWLARIPFIACTDFSFWEDYQIAVNRMLDSDEEKITTDSALDDNHQQNRLAQIKQTRIHFAALFDEKKYQKSISKTKQSLNLKAMQAVLFIYSYRDQPALQLPYRLLSALVSIDELFSNWRHAHALMVLRMLGKKIGTGGSSGYDYLRSTVDEQRIFSDITALTTFLIPRSSLPPLPDAIKTLLNFN